METKTIPIIAPVKGTILPLSEIPDPVFAQEMLGPAFAISFDGNGVLTARSPVTGTIAAMKPHAFVIKTDQDFSVLVHLGIDTVLGSAEQFEAMSSPTGETWSVGDHIRVGDPVSRWEPPKNVDDKALVLVSLLDLPTEFELERNYTDGSIVANDVELLTVQPK